MIQEYTEEQFELDWEWRSGYHCVLTYQVWIKKSDTTCWQFYFGADSYDNAKTAFNDTGHMAVLMKLKNWEFTKIKDNWSETVPA